MPWPERNLRGPQLYSAADVDSLDHVASLAREHLDLMLSHCVVGKSPSTISLALLLVANVERLGMPMLSIENVRGDAFSEPCSICVDDWVAHKRPPDEPFKEGQLVTVDLMIAKNGWNADVADTIVVGEGGHPLLDALDCVWEAGLAAIQPGVAWRTIAEAMNAAAKAHAANMVQGLAGHGIGIAPHELPVLPLVAGPSETSAILRPGMVLTLEATITSGSGETIDSEDDWAIRTADGAPVAGREAMIAVLEDGFRVLGGPVAGDSAGGAGYNPLRTGPGPGE